MSSSHDSIFVHQRLEVQRQLVEACRLQACAPWDVFILLLDLRSEFGRQVALHLRSRLEIDLAIRAAEAVGAPAAFSVPLPLQAGLAIVDMFVPSLHDQIVDRPPYTVTALIVDEHDDPTVAYIRLPGPRRTDDRSTFIEPSPLDRLGSGGATARIVTG